MQSCESNFHASREIKNSSYPLNLGNLPPINKYWVPILVWSTLVCTDVVGSLGDQHVQHAPYQADQKQYGSTFVILRLEDDCDMVSNGPWKEPSKFLRLPEVLPHCSIHLASHKGSGHSLERLGAAFGGGAECLWNDWAV